MFSIVLSRTERKDWELKKELLTVKELAAEVRISPKSIQRAYRKEEIPVRWRARSARMAGRARRRGEFFWFVWFADRTNEKNKTNQRNQNDDCGP